jgi:hypothetical protein
MISHNKEEGTCAPPSKKKEKSNGRIFLLNGLKKIQFILLIL